MSWAVYAIPSGWDIDDAEELDGDALAMKAPDGDIHVFTPIGYTEIEPA